MKQMVRLVGECFIKPVKLKRIDLKAVGPLTSDIKENMVSRVRRLLEGTSQCAWNRKSRNSRYVLDGLDHWGNRNVFSSSLIGLLNPFLSILELVGFACRIIALRFALIFPSRWSNSIKPVHWMLSVSPDDSIPPYNPLFNPYSFQTNFTPI